MFETASNKEIGNYLDILIRRKYQSDRQFARDYIERRYGPDSDESLQNMQNRISQIKHGNKSIQLEDLPYFSHMLEVSVDEILSAGKHTATMSNRPTNFSVAQSKDKEMWDEYINQIDKPFLNADEYNKTLIDYAFEFENHELLTYLMDKNIIWFVSGNKNDYGISLGAGTNIKRRDVGSIDTLDVYLGSNDTLRIKMITLAIKNSNYELLDKLHAREIPRLYLLTPTLGHHTLTNDPIALTPDIKELLKAIASSDDKTIEYFFNEFSIDSSLTDSTNTFIYPYLNELLSMMIKSKHPNANKWLTAAIDYNKSVHKKLLKASREALEQSKEYYKSINIEDDNSGYYKEAVNSLTWKWFFPYPKEGFFAYTNPNVEKGQPINGFVTNLIFINAKSSNSTTQALINELNSIYDSVMHMNERS
ncbi:hypothetical protein [Pseudobutyrivibrio ruminis]|uniref:Uncharacterized protein n=1 Tax=Pseudobutyrivibrio ruminis DSM 9787 TaxID=1123011 RepID=A0A285T516_9FIRM|nr:hypothetical protein [Pseudobutyrivibrio ruminis]SOC16452.1 hypothetical protein SAMN02910411_0405 [Pseudobutyrivibrio ruminis DSM 9787]